MPRFYIPIYAITLLLSAALLFSVQPMFSKMILPLLGGSPQVWNTAMLFFQLCLLGGYAYAHGTSRFLSIKAQATLHIILLLIFTLALPFGIPENWSTPPSDNPALWQLSLMSITVGGPFFVLAGSAPMLQRWFAGSAHPDAHNPYFLYGASNLGSMSALLAYPFIIEPLLTLTGQAQSWMFTYIALIAMMVCSAALVWKNSTPAHKANSAASPITWKQRGNWLLLSFIPSSLMLGVTTLITTDIASVPLLWVMPLAIYVGSFILVFARKPIFTEDQTSRYFAIAVIILIFQLVGLDKAAFVPALLIGLHLLVFFLAAMSAHTALANARPNASHLTEFYLLMALGGALGGFLNAIIAPQFFVIPLEYAAVLILAVFIRNKSDPGQSFKKWLDVAVQQFHQRRLDAVLMPGNLLSAAIIIAAIAAFSFNNAYIHFGAGTLIAIGLAFFYDKRWRFGILVLILLVLFPPGYRWGQDYFRDTLLQDRNFFGVIRVVNTFSGERLLMHGTTNHGTQALHENFRLIPLSYYSIHSPISNAFQYLDTKSGTQKIGIVGLGAGVTACYRKTGRDFDFYEIDPNIVAIAENPDYFTFLSDCGSPYKIILGDGRLNLQKQSNRLYDLLILDAFSSDNIPVHLMTEEAIRLYLSKIKTGGILLMHISNNYLDLEPVLSQIAKNIDVPTLAYTSHGGKIEDTMYEYFPSHVFAFLKNDEAKNYLQSKGWTAGLTRENVRGWSDQYSNIFSVLGNKTQIQRYKNQRAEKEIKPISPP